MHVECIPSLRGQAMMWVHQYPHVSSISSTQEPFVPLVVSAQRAHTAHARSRCKMWCVCQLTFLSEEMIRCYAFLQDPVQPPLLEGDGRLPRWLRSSPRAGGWGKRRATPALQKSSLPPALKKWPRRNIKMSRSRDINTRARCAALVWNKAT